MIGGVREHPGRIRAARRAAHRTELVHPRELGRAAGEIAVALAGGAKLTDISGSVSWTSPAGTKMTARFLAPLPVTAKNLRAVVDAGWIEKSKLCQGVTNGPAPCN